MTWMSIKRAIIFTQIAAHQFQQKKQILSSTISRAVHTTPESRISLLRSTTESASPCSNHRLHRPPLISTTDDLSIDYKIDIVDDETWQLSTGFATNPSRDQLVNHGSQNCSVSNSDFDEVDDLRIRGNLFYKLDRDSKEYEEYNFDFHRKKSKSKSKSSKTETKEEHDSMNERKTKGNPRNYEHRSQLPDKFEKPKKLRVPTFNQLTGPYHEPFCLDVFISKSSVRACIVHRSTSKVVAVAHSISKDMKYDMGSTKNAAACAAVGKVLAQRALADDIHNVVYTPRKGEKLEGKLEGVLQSVMNNGVCVKIKIKKKNVHKSGFHFLNYKHS